MSPNIGNLRVLKEAGVTKELDLASELFHRINRIIPPDQTLLTIPPTCTVREAVALMERHKYSQLPVVSNGQVLGVFSYRSLALQVAADKYEDITGQRCAPGDLRVDEFLEYFDFVRVTEEMSKAFESLNRDDGVLIGTPERLIGVLTPMDFLRYLYQVASPFVMVSEIELALRALIRIALRSEQIVDASRRCLAAVYGGPDNVPTQIEEMTFDNYQVLISYGDIWPLFEPVIGGTRTRASAKLKEIGEIRNALFHFKREITMEDHQTLANHRNWLLAKIKQAEVRRSGEVTA